MFGKELKEKRKKKSVEFYAKKPWIIWLVIFRGDSKKQIDRELKIWELEEYWEF